MALESCKSRHLLDFGGDYENREFQGLLEGLCVLNPILLLLIDGFVVIFLPFVVTDVPK